MHVSTRERIIGGEGKEGPISRDVRIEARRKEDRIELMGVDEEVHHGSFRFIGHPILGMAVNLETAEGRLPDIRIDTGPIFKFPDPSLDGSDGSIENGAEGLHQEV